MLVLKAKVRCWIDEGIRLFPLSIQNIHSYEAAGFQRSATQKQTLDPVWNETFELYVIARSTSMLWHTVDMCCWSVQCCWGC